MHIKNECIEGSKRGESDSQRELYDQLLPYLNSLCMRYLKDKSSRQDILQEAFISIFNKINQFDELKGAFHSWSAKITINLCLKHNRSSKAQYFDEITETVKTNPISPEAITNLTKEELVRFLKTMPEKYYEVYNLYVIEGFSHAEIAEIAGIRLTLSRKRLARAKEWLENKPHSLNALLGEYKVSITG